MDDNLAPATSTLNFGEVDSLFSEVLGREILGSSLSSGAARRRPRVCHEALEDGIGDAPLEAA